MHPPEPVVFARIEGLVSFIFETSTHLFLIRSQVVYSFYLKFITFKAIQMKTSKLVVKVLCSWNIPFTTTEAKGVVANNRTRDLHCSSHSNTAHRDGGSPLPSEYRPFVAKVKSDQGKFRSMMQRMDGSDSLRDATRRQDGPEQSPTNYMGIALFLGAFCALLALLFTGNPSFLGPPLSQKMDSTNQRPEFKSFRWVASSHFATGIIQFDEWGRRHREFLSILGGIWLI